MLVGGPALFLAAENMFRLRMIGNISGKRVITVAALCVCGVAASALPAVAVGAIVAGLLALLALWEAAGTTRRTASQRSPAGPGGHHAGHAQTGQALTSVRAQTRNVGDAA